VGEKSAKEKKRVKNNARLACNLELNDGKRRPEGGNEHLSTIASATPKEKSGGMYWERALIKRHHRSGVAKKRESKGTEIIKQQRG